MIISQLGLSPDTLRGETVIVTGAGGGIGYEAARALLWLGANVVIAEINQQYGRKAEVTLEKEFGKHRVLFVTTDVGDESSVKELYKLSVLAFGKVDAVINNATIAVLGNVVQHRDRDSRVVQLRLCQAEASHELPQYLHGHVESFSGLHHLL